MNAVAYFGTAYPHHFARDLDEIIAHGFDTVVLCVDEFAWRHALPNMAEMTGMARSRGVGVVANPWRVAGLFSGEATTSLGPGSGAMVEDREDLFRLWCRDVVSAGFDHVMLDEPRVDDVTGFCSRSYRYLRSLGARVTACLSDDVFGRLPDEALRTFPCDSLALGVFMWVTDPAEVRGRAHGLVSRLSRAARDATWSRPVVWVQGFDLPDGAEWIPETVHQVSRSAGVTDFGFWAFRACEATTSKRPANWQDVWARVPDWLGRG